MTQNEIEKIALQKYAIIAPLITGTVDCESKNSFFEQAAMKLEQMNTDLNITKSASTIERWYYTYLKEGFEGLKPKRRNDYGRSRKIDDDVLIHVKHLKSEYPRLPATLIYTRLIEEGIINSKDLSLSTITRLVKKLNIESKTTVNKDMRRYEREHINEVWCGDTSHGPYIKVNKKNIKTYIIALLDDSSRMIVGIDVFLNDNFVNLMSVIKSAVSKYGKPKIFNFDNGSTYRNQQMSLLSARLGSIVNYCAPYTPTSKAKLERWFRTLKDQWMASISRNEVLTLEQLKTSLFKFVNDYNNKIHSSLNGLSPHIKFFNESNLIIRLNDEEIEKCFLLEVERSVSADNVVVIDEIRYEVDYIYAKQRIKLRYSPDLSKIYVVDKDRNQLKEIKLLNKHENSHIKREKVRLSGGL
jgi:transposase InsO family protein